MCDFLLRNARVEGVELLPYHDFGNYKYNAVGASCQAFTTPAAARIEKLKKIIAEYGIHILDFK
jgi:pyruvate formate lyase activating enzyme